MGSNGEEHTNKQLYPRRIKFTSELVHAPSPRIYHPSSQDGRGQLYRIKNQCVTHKERFAIFRRGKKKERCNDLSRNRGIDPRQPFLSTDQTGGQQLETEGGGERGGFNCIRVWIPAFTNCRFCTGQIKSLSF